MLSNLCDHRVRSISAHLADSSSSSRSADKFWFITFEHGAIVLLKFNCGNIYGGREKRCNERRSDKGTPSASRRTDVRETRETRENREFFRRPRRDYCERWTRELSAENAVSSYAKNYDRGKCCGKAWLAIRKRDNVSPHQMSNQDGRDINRVLVKATRYER